MEKNIMITAIEPKGFNNLFITSPEISVSCVFAVQKRIFRQA